VVLLFWLLIGIKYMYCGQEVFYFKEKREEISLVSSILFIHCCGVLSWFPEWPTIQDPFIPLCIIECFLHWHLAYLTRLDHFLAPFITVLKFMLGSNTVYTKYPSTSPTLLAAWIDTNHWIPAIVVALGLRACQCFRIIITAIVITSIKWY